MPQSSSLYRRSILDISSLSDGEIDAVIQNAKAIKKSAHNDALAGKTLVNLFFENSTRTRASFELAAKQMGMHASYIQASHSSTQKGESLADTVKTLEAYDPEVLVMRHPRSQAALIASTLTNIPIINAGDGSHAHPTQALTDLLTILEHKKSIKGLTVAICGDIVHSRVARSNLALLTRLGAKVRLIAPPTLLSGVYLDGVEQFYSLKEGIKNADVIIALRIQHERMRGMYVPSLKEYYQLYGITHETLKHAKSDCIVLHPGPVNREVELSSDLVDDREHCKMLDQVKNGLAVRKALLQLLLTKK